MKPQGSVRCEGVPVGEEFTGVVEDDDTVTQQAPALFGMCGHDARGGVVGGLYARARRPVLTHEIFPSPKG